MPTAKKLIEVALPIKEISAESVRDKSIRHGHISTLHLWWARRPLPVCRAVVFASLVPDPLDPHCPPAFREAVALLLGRDENTKQDPYRPYDDIPWTPPVDPMEDNLRNRLQMFIGKFSDQYCRDVKAGKVTAAKDMLDANSLIKWDNKNNETTLNKARKLIWVAHNAHPERSEGSGTHALLADFDTHYAAIKSAEAALYTIHDRHLPSSEVVEKEAALHQAIEAFLDKMPRVFDPFAGGGAIPLEAARLGCRAFGNDINPVAHIIQKGSLEFPQKFGKPITYSVEAFLERYGSEELEAQRHAGQVFGQQVQIANRLSFDVAFYAKKLLSAAEAEIGHLYPADEKGNKPIAYYWARVGTCSNPSCRAEVPLLKGFYLANTSTKQVYLQPIINGTEIDFEIKRGNCESEGFVQNRKSLVCPCCGNATSNAELKTQFLKKSIAERLLAVIEESDNGKAYRLPTKAEISVIANIPNATISIPEAIAKDNTKQFDLCPWGFLTFGDMFSPRQLLALQTLVARLYDLQTELTPQSSDYGKAILTYLGILADRVAIKQNSFITWDTSRETISNLFGKQAIQMVFDYVEGNPFSSSAGSASNALDWICRYIESESDYAFYGKLINASSGDKSQFLDKYLTAVVTDPPYYDAIAYGDISDFFYVWLKRTLGDVYPLNFATPQTPKTDECTALKHHHNGKADKAKAHFEQKLTEIFVAIEHQTSDIVSIMFAHQSTEAWTTLCNSILVARMNITGSWPIDTEMANRTLGLAGAVLASSVTVAARPAQRQGYGDFKEVKKAIEVRVAEEVELLYALGFRGADLLTACFGQAVSEFGRYKKVEKADGSEVTVAELLELSREAAFNALLKGFDGDDFTKFYIGWLQLYGFLESDFDDAAKFSRVGLSVNVQELFNAHLLLKNGNKQTLGNYAERMEAFPRLGESADSPLIDRVHRTLALYADTDRAALLQYITRTSAEPTSAFWRVLVALCEVLPAGSEDQKQALGLLTNKDSLIRESKNPIVGAGVQPSLFE
jgi:adenine-specific DNA methylase